MRELKFEEMMKLDGGFIMPRKPWPTFPGTKLPFPLPKVIIFQVDYTEIIIDKEKSKLQEVKNIFRKGD